MFLELLHHDYQALELLRRLKHLEGLGLDHRSLEGRELIVADGVQLGLVVVEFELASFGAVLGELDQLLLLPREVRREVGVPHGSRQQHLLLDAELASHDQRANPHAKRHAVGAAKRHGRLEQLARGRVGELRLDDRQELTPAQRGALDESILRSCVTWHWDRAIPLDGVAVEGDELAASVGVAPTVRVVVGTRIHTQLSRKNCVATCVRKFTCEHHDDGRSKVQLRVVHQERGGQKFW